MGKFKEEFDEVKSFIQSTKLWGYKEVQQYAKFKKQVPICKKCKWCSKVSKNILYCPFPICPKQEKEVSDIRGVKYDI